MTKNELLKLGKTTKEAESVAEKARVQKTIAFTIDRVNNKIDEMVDYILRRVSGSMSNGDAYCKFLVSDLRKLDDAEKETNDEQDLYHYVSDVEYHHKDESLPEIVENMLAKRSDFLASGGNLNRFNNYGLNDYCHFVAGIAQELALRKLRRAGFSIEKVYWHGLDDKPTEYAVYWDDVPDDYSFPA